MRIAISGHTGRVGQELIKTLDSKGHTWVAGWNRSGQSIVNPKGELLQKHWNKKEIDIVIDFSLAENFKNVFDWCLEHKIPLVSGATGLGELNHSVLKKISGHKDLNLEIPFFWSSNMSLGIALIRQFIKKMGLFKAVEFEVSEVHHLQKLDSPSGTAITLAQDVEQAFGLKDKIAIKAQRIDGVFGIHKVKIKSEDEIVEFYHEALNRKVFANGALQIAEWLYKKNQPGFFSLGDFLGDVE